VKKAMTILKIVDGKFEMANLSDFRIK